MKSKKLLISANSAWNIYSRKRLLLSLQKEGWEIVALSNPDSSAEKLENELHIRFIPLPMKNDGTKLIDDIALFIRFLILYIQEKPFAALHINNKPNIYGSMAASILGIPSVSNITGLGVVAEKKKLTQKIVYSLYKVAFLSRNAFVFFQNTDDKHFFLERNIIKESKTGLLPGSGVNTDYYQPVNSEKKSTDHKEKIRFLYNSRLLITKGARDFIQAATMIRVLYPDTVFTIIGEHDPSNSIFISLEELTEAEKKGIIEYCGVVSDVRTYIGNADCVVLPSYYREGVPRSLLEAASMGKPLIVANSVGTREPVENGVNGYLTIPADLQSLEEAMISFICSTPEEKEKMGRASRSIALTRFTDTLIATAYLNILTELKTRTR